MLKLVVADDESSPTGNLTAAQSLVSKGAFGIVASSAAVRGHPLAATLFAARCSRTARVL